MIRTCIVLLLAAAICAADPAPFADAARADAWKFLNPKDFPGANGKLAASDAGLDLSYDFSAGGVFVGMVYKGKVPVGTGSIGFTLQSTGDTMCQFRLVTEDGRTFQGFNKPLKAGTPLEMVLPTDKPWAEAWGGPDTKTPQAAIKTFHILVTKKSPAATGTVTVSNFTTIAK